MKKTYYFNDNLKSEFIKYVLLTILIVILNALFYIDILNEYEELLIEVRITLLICSLIIITGYIYSAIFLIRRYKSKKGVLTFSRNEIKDTFIYIKIGQVSMFRLILPVKSIPYNCLDKVKMNNMSELWHSKVDVKNMNKNNANIVVRLFLSICGYSYGDYFCDIDYDDIVGFVK